MLTIQGKPVILATDAGSFSRAAKACINLFSTPNTVENFITETVFPDSIPNVLHWVEFGTVRRKEDQGIHCAVMGGCRNVGVCVLAHYAPGFTAPTNPQKCNCVCSPTVIWRNSGEAHRFQPTAHPAADDSYLLKVFAYYGDGADIHKWKTAQIMS